MGHLSVELDLLTVLGSAIERQMLLVRRALSALTKECALVRHGKWIARCRFASWAKLRIKQTLITGLSPHAHVTAVWKRQLDQVLSFPDIHLALPVVINVGCIVHMIGDDLFLGIGIRIVTNERKIEI